MRRSIFIMRHCQTELSDKKRLIGQCDVELSQEGVILAEKIGRDLKKNAFEHIICSGLTRAKQTANIISSYLNIQPESESRLNEINLGQWDGLFIEDIVKKYPEAYEARGRNMIDYRTPDGENFVDLSLRVTDVFNEMLEKPGNMIIVAHKSVNRIILANILGMPLKNISKISQDYGCCNILIQKDREIHVKAINLQLKNHFKR